MGKIAFSEDEDILSQTSEQDETLQQAAYKAMNHAEVSFDNVLAMKKPEDLGDTQWKAVLGRCRELHQRMGMEEQLDEDMTSISRQYGHYGDTVCLYIENEASVAIDIIIFPLYNILKF